MKLMKKNYIYRILSALVLCIMVAGCGRSGNGKEENLKNNVGIDSIQSESSAQTESTELPKAEETEEGAVKEIELSEIPENMLAYWMVLNNKKPFVSMNEDKQQFYLKEYFWYLNEVETAYHADCFMVVDMDGDGEEEVVLECTPGTSQILHYEDGKVYSYQFGIRGMKRIYKNGIYDASDGAANNYFRRLTELNKDGYTEETLARMDGDYYEIEGKETTCDGFFDYVEKIESIGLAERMELAEETIDQQILGNLTDQGLAFVKQLPKENMLEDEPNYQENKETLQLYRAALSGEEDIIYVIMDTFPEDYDSINVYFSIVDMDGDGEDELVFIQESDQVSDLMEILHYEDGQVYSYQFRPLKFNTAMVTTDGVFQTEDDLSSTGYARITAFEKDGCKIEPVEGYESGSHDRVRYYFYSEEAIARWLE